MAKAAIVRTRDNRLQCFFHAQDAGVCVRGYENGGWGKPRVLLHGARDVFSVNMAEDGRLYVFAQDAGGNMHLCTSSAEVQSGWNDQTILRSQMSTTHGACFHALVSEVGLHLIYNIPSGEGRGQQIVSQRLGVDGRWGVANSLGGVSSIGGRLFQTQMAGRRHMLLFYQSCDPDCALGYREVTPERIGEMHVLHTTGYQIADASFVTMADALHALYIVKSPFSCQLIYRRKDGAGLSDPAVIWEAQKADNCLLFFAEGRLTASCVSNGQVFSCTANDAFVFSRPVRVRTAFTTEAMKAVYLSEPPMEMSAFFCREVYVDKARPWETQLLGIPHSSFYPLQIQLDLPSARVGQAAPPRPVPEEYDAAWAYEAAEMPMAKAEAAAAPQAETTATQAQVTEALMQMRAQLEKAVRDNAEKDMRVAHLTKRLQENEDELNAMELRLRERPKKEESVVAEEREAPMTTELEAKIEPAETEELANDTL